MLQERRVNKVQLARLAVSDLLALLGLPANEARLDPPGLVVLRVHLGQQVKPGPRGHRGHKDQQA